VVAVFVSDSVTTGRKETTDTRGPLVSGTGRERARGWAGSAAGPLTRAGAQAFRPDGPRERRPAERASRPNR
jgi:hypothetical protein